MIDEFKAQDKRLDELQRNLAQLQFENIPLELEANLLRETLDHALTSGVTIARTCMAVLDEIGDSFEESVERMQRDLNGE